MKPLTAPLLALAALSLASCGKEPPPREIVRPVKAMQAGSVSSVDKATLTGKARATREVDVAFEVSGRIVEFPAQVGDVRPEALKRSNCSGRSRNSTTMATCLLKERALTDSTSRLQSQTKPNITAKL